MGTDPEGAETPAEIVRRARGKQTLDAFAAELGTSRQVVIDWEAGRHRPGDKYRPLIAARANVSPAVLERPKTPRLEDAVAALHESMEAFRALVATTGIQDEDGLPIRPVSARLAGLEARLAGLEADVAGVAELARKGFAEIGKRLDALGQQQPASAPRARTPRRREA